MSRSTRKTKGTIDDMPEKLPEKEEDLRTFIQNVVEQSQSVLLERINELEQSHADAIEALELKHAEDIENLRVEFKKKIASLEEDVDAAKAKGKEQKKRHDKLE